MLVAIVLLLGAQATDIDAKTMMATAQKRTDGVIRCEAPKGDDITVCGRRDADHYRVPLIAPHADGDPAHEPVMAERKRLQAQTSNCEEKSLFLTGCGSAGVSASTSGGIQPEGERPLAP
jgi:hypothetical protein